MEKTSTTLKEPWLRIQDHLSIWQTELLERFQEIQNMLETIQQETDPSLELRFLQMRKMLLHFLEEIVHLSQIHYIRTLKEFLDNTLDVLLSGYLKILEEKSPPKILEDLSFEDPSERISEGKTEEV